MPSKIDHISLLESPEYLGLKEFCRDRQIDLNLVVGLLWIINAEPHLNALIRILNNLNSIIQTAFDANIIAKSDIDDAQNCQQVINQLLKNPTDLTEEKYCGPNLAKSYSIKRNDNFVDHPLRNKCLGTNPLYALLWNKASTNKLEEHLRKLDKNRSSKDIEEESHKFEKKYRLLQWHLFYMHRDLIRKHTSLRSYLKHSNKSGAILEGHNDSLKKSCQAARYYDRHTNWFHLDKFQLEQPTLKFAEEFAELASDTLGKLADVKTLGKKWQKSRAHLRFRESGSKSYSTRMKSTSYYVSFDEFSFISYVQEENNSSEPSLRTLNFWNPTDDWKGSDLPREEAGDDTQTEYLAKPYCKGNKSEHDQIMAAIGRVNAEAMNNQNLIISYDLLTIQEIASSMKRLGSIIKRDTEQQVNKISSVLAILTYWIGCGFDKMHKLVVLKNTSFIENQKGVLYLYEDKLWRIPVPVYKTVKHSTEKQSLCRPAGNFLFLPDIWNSESMLKSIDYENEITNNGIFKPFTNHKLKSCKSKLKMIFQNLVENGSRISTARINKDLSLRISRLSDPAIALLITGQKIKSAQVTRHYTTLSVAHLRELYLKVTLPLLQKIRNEEYEGIPYEQPLPALPVKEFNESLGANFCPTVETAKALLSELKKNIENSIDDRKYHNNYALYTAIMIGFCTGYRAVHDINLGPDRRDEITETAWISDKDNVRKEKTRKIWLYPVLSQHLHEYEAHRKIIHASWESHFSKISKPAIDELPYLFIITEKDEQQYLTPISDKSTRNFLKKLNYPLPLNSNRRLLRSELLESGCDVDVVNAFMGHAANGEEPHGPFSCLSPRKERDQLRKHLQPLLKIIGIAPIKSRWVTQA